jgi:hypothetical protein
MKRAIRDQPFAESGIKRQNPAEDNVWGGANVID